MIDRIARMVYRRFERRLRHVFCRVSIDPRAGLLAGAIAMLAACHSTRVRPQSALPASDAAVIDSVRRIWDELDVAWDAGDTVPMSPIFATDLRAVTASGRVLGRAEVLQFIARNGSDTGATAGQSHESDKTIRLVGQHADVAVCTAEATDVINANHGIDTVITQVTDVFERRTAGWQLVFSHESYERPPRELPRSWRRFASDAPAPPTGDGGASSSGRVTVRNRYYAKAGKAADVYRIRVRASAVLRQLGLSAGSVLRGDGGESPDVVWEVTLDSALLSREGQVAAASPAFQAIMKRMGALARRFESSVSRETRMFVEESSPTTRRASAGVATADPLGDLERAARARIVAEQDAFRRKDAEAFQPCSDTGAVVLRDFSGAAHTCLAVRRHMAERMRAMGDGAMRVRIDSVLVRGDSGLVYEAVHFRRSVPQLDGMVHEHSSDVDHLERWRIQRGEWRLQMTEELTASRVFVDGRPAPP